VSEISNEVKISMRGRFTCLTCSTLMDGLSGAKEKNADRDEDSRGRGRPDRQEEETKQT